MRQRQRSVTWSPSQEQIAERTALICWRMDDKKLSEPRIGPIGPGCFAFRLLMKPGG